MISHYICFLKENVMTEFTKILLPAMVILTLVLLGLGITILFKRNGKFPDTHIHSNKYLREKDIHCVQKEDKMEQDKVMNKEKFRNIRYLNK